MIYSKVGFEKIFEVGDFAPFLESFHRNSMSNVIWLKQGAELFDAYLKSATESLNDDIFFVNYKYRFKVISFD